MIAAINFAKPHKAALGAVLVAAVGLSSSSAFANVTKDMEYAINSKSKVTVVNTIAVIAKDGCESVTKKYTDPSSPCHQGPPKRFELKKNIFFK